MKKRTLLLLSVLLVFNKLSFSQNLITNGDFNCTASGTGFVIDAFTSNLVPNWYKLAATPDIHLSLGETSAVLPHCARLQSSTTSSEAIAQDLAIPLIAGRQYYLSFLARPTPTTAVDNRIQVQFTNGGTAETVILNNYATSVNTYQQVELCFTANANWSTIVFRNLLSSNNTVNSSLLVDKVELYALDIQATVSNTLICLGQDITLSDPSPLVPGTQYLWQDLSTNTTVSNTASVSLVPTTGSHTYRLTKTFGNSTCSLQEEVSVTINPTPVVNASISPATLCVGDPAVITVNPGSNATSYTYSSPGSPNVLFSGSVSVNPTTAGTLVYTVTGYKGSCTASVPLPLNVSPCLCTGGYEIGSNGVLNAGNYGSPVYMINNDVTLNGDVTFSNCEIRLAPGVEIVVPNGKQFNIISSAHLYACNSMWDGIRVEAGGKIKISGQSPTGKPALIEDARTAIGFQGGGTLNTMLNVQHTVFNRNNVGIAISDYVPDVNNYNISIQNTVFTCRAMPASVYGSWPSLSGFTLTAFKAATLNTNATLLDDQFIPQTSYPFANLKAPMSSLKSAIGINLVLVGLSLAEDTPNPSYRTVTLGSSGSNLFNVYDQQGAGIQAARSNVNVLNSKFQNAVIDSNPALPATAKGHGIFVQTSKGAKNKVSVQLSEFTNCHYALDVNNYFDIEVLDNTVKSTQSTADYSLNSNMVHPGLNGIWLKTNQYRAVKVNNNNLYNIDKGIIFSSGFGAYLLGPALNLNYKYSGQVDITNNMLRSNYAGYSTATTYLKEAIIVDNVAPLAPGSASSMLAGSTVNASKNHIYDAYRGILARNWNAKKVLIEKNSPVTLKEELPAGFAQLQFGISNENNSGLSSAINIISENKVYGFVNDNNSRQTAILSSGSSNQRVSCNQTFNAYHGIKFDHTNLITLFMINSMSDHYYAFALDEGGIIGPQYTTYTFLNDPTTRYQPFDNKWLGNSTYKTATLNFSSAASSIFYVRDSQQYPEYNPIGSSFTDASGIPGITDYYYTSSNTGNLRYSSTEPPIAPLLSCNPGTFLHIDPQPLNEGQLRQLEKIARDEVPYELYPDEHSAINGQRLYRLLDENPELRANSLDLQTFYENSQAGNRRKLRVAEQLLAGNAYAAAENELSSMMVNNEADRLSRAYYLLYSRMEQDSALSVADSLELYGYAALCPYIYGPAVFQARALYGLLFNYAVNFENACPETGSTPQLQQETAMAVTEAALPGKYRLYPNPSGGSFFVEVVEDTDAPLLVQLIDAFGRVLFEQELEGGREKQLLQTEIPDGMYTLVIINSITDEKQLHKIWIHP